MKKKKERKEIEALTNSDNKNILFIDCRNLTLMNKLLTQQ